MKATVSYAEISGWVRKHFHVTPVLKRLDEKSIEVSFNPGRFIPTVRIMFKIEAMRKDVVCLSYDCSAPVSLLITGAVGHIQSKIPNGIEIKSGEKRINVYLEKIDKLKKPLKYVAPTDLSFGEDEISLNIALV